MEKRIRHYDLDKIKQMLMNAEFRVITRSAKIGAIECGYANDQEIVDEVLCIEDREFYKSMTADQNHHIWQDVYKIRRPHPIQEDVMQILYVKLQISPTQHGVVISFKRETDFLTVR